MSQVLQKGLAPTSTTADRVCQALEEFDQDECPRGLDNNWTGIKIHYALLRVAS